MSPSESTGPPLRIAHVITRLINGGADENTVLSCNHAARAGHSVTLVHGLGTDDEILAKVDARVRLVAVPALVRPVAPIGDARALTDLVRMFQRDRFDVVHTHTSKAGILGRLAARLARVPIVVHGVHNTVPFIGFGRLEKIVYLAAEKLVKRITHAFIDVSSGVRDLYVNAGLGTLEQHHVIHSGFELARFRNAVPPHDWQTLLRLDDEEARPAVILLIAAFAPHKRHLELLESFPRVVARFPDVRLVFAGDGELRPAIEARIDSLGLRRNVIVAGFYPEPEKLIALADVCVLTSKREGLPRVVMQYLAGGKPVVATSLPGLEEILRDAINGAITASDDLDGWADAVIALLADDALRARLAHGAAATDLSAWDADHVGSRLETVYQTLFGELRSNHREIRGSSIRDGEEVVAGG
jgi:glycosyltransferase involved in cell wall biosynthesis